MARLFHKPVLVTVGSASISMVSKIYTYVAIFCVEISGSVIFYLKRPI